MHLSHDGWKGMLGARTNRTTEGRRYGPGAAEPSDPRHHPHHPGSNPNPGPPGGRPGPPAAEPPQSHEGGEHIPGAVANRARAAPTFRLSGSPTVRGRRAGAPVYGPNMG
eukprot:1195856-Prorocentrum_minimum.AAC.1